MGFEPNRANAASLSDGYGRKALDRPTMEPSADNGTRARETSPVSREKKSQRISARFRTERGSPWRAGTRMHATKPEEVGPSRLPRARSDEFEVAMVLHRLPNLPKLNAASK